MLIKRLLIVGITFCICSCATYTKHGEITGPVLGWSQRQTQLNAITDWKLTGAIGGRDKKSGWNASLSWQQQANQFVINLFGPLGARSVEISGTPQYVTLDDGKQKVSSSSPENLLARQTGWRVPVTHLYYWIRGLPVPQMPKKQKLDARNRISFLQQAGWLVSFEKYMRVRDIELPKKIVLRRPPLQIKIIVRRWSL